MSIHSNRKLWQSHPRERKEGWSLDDEQLELSRRIVHQHEISASVQGMCVVPQKLNPTPILPSEAIVWGHVLVLRSLVLTQNLIYDLSGQTVSNCLV